MVQALHQLIDQLAGILLTLLGEVEVDHGGFHLGMAHVFLDDAQVDASLQEMGGVAVAQGMNGDTFFSDSCIILGTTEGALDTTFGHGSLSLLCSIAVSAKGREDETRMTVGHPIAAQQVEGGLGKRHVAILGTLATVDMDHHAAAVDIGDFEMESFVSSYSSALPTEKDQFP
jgi:hypothetical protein